MKFYDITMNITKDMMVYKNKPEKQPQFHVASDFVLGSSFETQLSINLHTGTHIDFPKHMNKTGGTSTGFNPLNLVREVKVLNLTHVKDNITPEHLAAFNIKENDFLLFKTTNSNDTAFNFNFVYLSKEGAAYLAEKNIGGVGIDALGIERSQPNHETHHILFDNNIIILEGICLKDVQEGSYNMLALPLKIDDVEALPIRAILTKNDTFHF
jgi:arylformamidase